MKLIYVVLLIFAIWLAMYSWLYEKEVVKAKKRVGFLLPIPLRKLMRVAKYTSIIAIVGLGIICIVEFSR